MKAKENLFKVLIPINLLGTVNTYIIKLINKLYLYNTLEIFSKIYADLPFFSLKLKYEKAKNINCHINYI